MFPPIPATSPPWLQILTILVLLIVVIAQVARDWVLNRGKNINDREKTFMDSLIKTAEQFPVQMEMNQKLITANGLLEARIIVLERQVSEQQEEIKDLRSDRDSWKGQATRVPELEGQVLAWKEIASTNAIELERVRIQLLQEIAKKTEIVIPEKSNVRVTMPGPDQT